MNRRQLLKGMLAMPAVALAAKMQIPEAIAEEMQEEMAKDLTKTVVQVPGQVFIPDNKLWQSTAMTRDIYAHYVAEQLAKQYDAKIVEQLSQKVKPTVRKLTSAIEQDISVNNLEDEKIILGMPKVEIKYAQGVFSKGEPTLVLKAGIDQEVGLLGHKKLNCGFIQEKLVDQYGNRL